MKILVIHGPNLNLLGSREENIYGREKIDEINRKLEDFANENSIELKVFQSNSEGEIVNLIHNWSGWADWLIINPAAYTHTSVAIRDALLATKIRTIEVHISNIYGREDFRRKSMISDIVDGVITGFGVLVYKLAIMAIMEKKI